MTHDHQAALRAYDEAIAAPYTPPAYSQLQSPAQTGTPRRDQYLARLTPLHERLGIALAKFPSELTADGLHISQIWGLTSGVQRNKPRAFEVAAALRELGWTRIRFYSDSGPSQTAWFPPSVNPTDAKNALKARTRA